ncbi:MAG: DinB family protein [Leptonema sp. (in: bacteria)]
MNIQTPEQIRNIEEYIQQWRTLREDFLHSIGQISENLFTKPIEKGWSASQISEHLFLSQYLFAIFLPKVLKGVKGYSKNELNSINHQEIIEKLSRPFSGIQNPVVVTPKNYWDKKTAIQNLKKSMQILERNLRNVDIKFLKERGAKHEIFGPISILDFIFILLVHEKGHLEALKEKFLKN